MKEITKEEFALNSAWKIMEQFSAKGISMIISIILARILSPSDYGLLALTSVFTSLSDILIDGGFSTALIRKESVDEYDYSAVLAVSFAISVFLYLILFFFSPLIAEYYDSPYLTNVLRVMGLTFFIQAFTAVGNGIVNRNMQFRLLFTCDILASITSGIIGILFAYLGFGVWALVIQRLIQQIILTIAIYIKVKWRFHRKIKLARVKAMFSFSIGVVGASLLNYFGGNLYSIAIGKKYSVTDLGYYDKGNQLPMQFSLYTFGAMSSVLLPTISMCQDDLARVKRIVRKVVRMTSFLIMPMMIGLAVTSKEVICLLFTEKWLPCVTIMQCACLYYMATPYMLINVQVFFALGYSKLRVKTEIIRLTMMAIGLLIFGFFFQCTMDQLAIVSAVIAVLTVFVTFYEVRKLIGYSMKEVLKDIWKALTGALVMGLVIVLLEKKITLDGVLLPLLLKVLAGIIVYVFFVFALKMPELDEIICLLKRRKVHE